jgi:hypothetical protein
MKVSRFRVTTRGHYGDIPVDGSAGKRGYAAFAAEGMLSLLKYKK